MSGETPSPGWYADPAGGEGVRWWDGRRWTSEVRASTGPAATGSPPDTPTGSDVAPGSPPADPTTGTAGATTAAAETAAPGRPRRGKGLLVGGFAVILAAALGVTAVLLVGDGDPSPDAARAGLFGDDVEPTTMTLSLTGSLDYDALPPDRVDGLRAQLGPVERALRITQLTFARDADRLHLGVDLRGEDAVELDVATVPGEEAIAAAGEHGGQPSEEARDALSTLGGVPDSVSGRVDLGMFAAFADNPVRWENQTQEEFGRAHPLLGALADGQPVEVTDLAWVWPALYEALGGLGGGPEDAAEATPVRGLLRDLGAVVQDYAAEHVTVEQVDTPAPEGVPEGARALELRAPVGSALHLLADLVEHVERRLPDQGTMAAEPGATIRGLREVADHVPANDARAQLRAHAWMVDGQLRGLRLPAADLVASWIVAIEVLEKHDAPQSPAERQRHYHEFVDDLALEVIIEPGPLEIPRVSADRTSALVPFVNDLARSGSAILDEGSAYAQLVALLSTFGGQSGQAPDAGDEDVPVAEKDPEGDDEDEGDDFSGTSVSVFGAPTSVEEQAMNSVIEEFVNEPTGMNATYEGSDSFEEQVQIRIEGGDPPDVALFPHPGAVLEQAELGNAVSLEDLGFDIAELEDRFGEYLLSLGEYEGEHYGIPTNINYKSMAWYNTAIFEDEGYEVPETFEDMISLSEQMVEDGYTPWVIGTGSDDATGWPATDWMEDLMLRTVDPETYDAWVEGELAFDSDEVRNAADLFGEVALNEDFVVGDPANIPDLDFRDAPDALFADDGAVMHRQASFVTSFFPDDVELGEDVDWFQFPSIDGQQGALIAGELAAVFDDRPEVEEFVRRYTAEDAQCAGGGFVDDATGQAIQRISPNLNVGSDCYADEVVADSAGQIVEALQEGTAKFDASDLMPPAVGSGSFWDGLNEWMRGADLDTVLQDIDAAWPE